MNKYDTVPYPIISHSQTHPAALATLALLHGLKPAPVEHCRVLEIGCASGGNLIPMAYGLPGSQFLGLDYSPRQIAEGQALLQTLDLKNIRLELRNLLDVDESLGQFDYIIAHGFYSWVPPAVREKLFDVCRRCLSPSGVAYISFNAYPGWKTLSAVREAMLYRTRRTDDLFLKAAQARELLDFLVEFMSKAKNVSTSVAYAHADFLKHIAEKLKGGEDSYLVHDILEDTNDPVYFHEFIAQAERHDLQYLADTDFRSALASNLPPAVAQTLSNLSDNRLEWEQYTDFLSNRMFRQTLLCRAGVPINFTVTPEILRALRYASPARVEAEPEAAAPAATQVEKFVGIDGATLATDHPVSIAALWYLIGLWPQSATFDTLLAQAYARLQTPPPATRAEAAETDATMLASNLLKAFTYSPRLVEFSVYQPALTLHVSERPVASAWARLQASHLAALGIDGRETPGRLATPSGRGTPLGSARSAPEGERQAGVPEINEREAPPAEGGRLAAPSGRGAGVPEINENSGRLATVTTLRHERYALQPFEQFVLQQLDGSRDRDMIVDSLLDGPVATGELTTQQAGEPVTDPAQIRALLSQEVERTLRAFARAPLLVG